MGITRDHFTTSVCKTIKAMGITNKHVYLNLVNHLSKQIRSGGPEFLLTRLSNLVDWRKKHMEGDTSYRIPWFKVTRRSTPADPVGASLWKLPNKSFFAIIGGIRKAIVYSDNTDKQLVKWLEGIRCQDIGDHSISIRPTCTRGQKWAREKHCQFMEQRLRSLWESCDMFSVKHLTGASIPYDQGVVPLFTKKYGPNRDPGRLVTAYMCTLNSCPLFAYRFFTDMIDLGAYKRSYPEGHSFMEFGRSQLRNEYLIDAAVQGVNFDLLPPARRAFSRKGQSFLARTKTIPTTYTENFGFLHSVGRIGFIQEKAGKLRSVANPNRLVQYLSVPLGEALASLMEFYHGQYVYDQKKGKDWAQKELAKGYSLSSFDMSSATDTLDYKRFLKHFFGEDLSQYPFLERNLWYFEDVSQGLWAIPAKVADHIAAPKPLVSWTVGQPLGLRPSFPLLTIMNCHFAEVAISEYWCTRKAELLKDSYFKDTIIPCAREHWKSFDNKPTYNTFEKVFHIMENDLKGIMDKRDFIVIVGELLSNGKAPIKVKYPYACVGDDMIIDTRMADRYVNIVRAYNGRISQEKGTVSSVFTEFCSTIITKSDQYPLKPGFLWDRDGSFTNLERFSVSGLKPRAKKWIRDLFDQVTSLAIPSFTKLDLRSRNPKSLAHRLASYFISDVTDKLVRDLGSVDLNTLYYRSLQDTAKWCEERYTYIDNASGKPWKELSDIELQRIVSHNMCQYDFYSHPENHSMSVEMMPIMRWNNLTHHHENCYSILNLVERLVKVDKNIQFNVEKDHNLMEAKYKLPDGTEIHLIMPSNHSHDVSLKWMNSILVDIRYQGGDNAIKAMNLDPFVDYNERYKSLISSISKESPDAHDLPFKSRTRLRDTQEHER